MTEPNPGCTGKIRYLNRWGAKRARDDMAGRRGKRLHIYHCDWCDGWHLTSSALPREGYRQFNEQVRAQREAR